MKSQRKSGLKRTANFVMVVGSLASVALLLHAGGRGVSPVLTFLMTVWVLAPFAVLDLIRRALRRWQIVPPGVLHTMILVVTGGATAIYAADAVSPLNSKAAFVYVVTPLCAWGLIAVTLLIARLRPMRHLQEDGGDEK